MNEEVEQNKMETSDISEEAFALVEGLLAAAKQAEILELEESETKYLEENGLPEAKYYKMLATIDLANNDNLSFRQGIMLLVDALAHIEEKHPEILVAGEDEEHAEVQLVAPTKELLDLPYEDALKFIAGMKENFAKA
jgi:hypothetical protein